MRPTLQRGLWFAQCHTANKWQLGFKPSHICPYLRSCLRVSREKDENIFYKNQHLQTFNGVKSPLFKFNLQVGWKDSAGIPAVESYFLTKALPTLSSILTDFLSILGGWIFPRSECPNPPVTDLESPVFIVPLSSWLYFHSGPQLLKGAEEIWGRKGNWGLSC